MAQTTRAKASPIIAIRTPQPPFGLLPWCFRDLECDFRASFEFRQSLVSLVFYDTLDHQKELAFASEGNALSS
jgi:hypothetical protein